MTKPMQWDEAQIGRKFRLRDLHVLFTVAQSGSMGKAALKLGVSQPTVSEVVAGLENLVGAQLFERSARGIQLTPYGDALLKRSQNVFDELKQGLRDLQYLSDPTVGELRIGCPEIDYKLNTSPRAGQFLATASASTRPHESGQWFGS